MGSHVAQADLGTHLDDFYPASASQVLGLPLFVFIFI